MEVMSYVLIAPFGAVRRIVGQSIHLGHEPCIETTLWSGEGTMGDEWSREESDYGHTRVIKLVCWRVGI